MSFWNSVLILRQVEFVTLWVVMIVPILCGSVLLTVHYRVKMLMNKTTVSQSVNYEENVQRLDNTNRALIRELQIQQSQLGTLQHDTAGRHVTENQEAILLEKLRGVKSSPVIIAAYAFEDESVAYAIDIATVLRRAGLDVTMNKSSMNDFKGVGLATLNLSQRPIAGARELAQAFSSAHVEAHQREIAPDTIAGQLQDGSLLVVIGRK